MIDPAERPSVIMGIDRREDMVASGMIFNNKLEGGIVQKDKNKGEQVTRDSQDEDLANRLAVKNKSVYDMT